MFTKETSFFFGPKIANSLSCAFHFESEFTCFLDYRIGKMILGSQLVTGKLTKNWSSKFGLIEDIMDMSRFLLFSKKKVPCFDKMKIAQTLF